MKEIKKNIFIIPGKNSSIFPYCTCLYLKGKETRVLIDAGMGQAGMRECVKMGIDILVLTHCHYDHRSTINLITDVPVWCHEIEVPYIEDSERFIKGVGLSRSGLDYTKIFMNLPYQTVKVSKTLHDLERVNLGGLYIEAIHVPGHAPGQIALYVPEADFLFTADVSLHSFGPFYGHDFADIDDSIRSIRRLKAVGATTVVSSNCGPFTRDNDRRFSEYEKIIYTRDRLLLGMLDRPRAFDYFLGKGIIYANASGMKPVMKWWERVHVEKHIERFMRTGLIKKEGNLYHRT